MIKFGSFAGALSKFSLGTVGGLSQRQTGTLGLDNTGGYITLTINGDTPKWTGLDSNAWKVGTTGANQNWRLITVGTTTDYIEGDNVLFDDTASGNTNLNISTASVSPTVTTFNNSTLTYSVSSTGGFGIGGSGSLTKNGTAGLTISTPNSYSGGTILNAGTVALSGSNTLGATTGTVALDGGTLDLGTTSQTVGATTITAAAASGNTMQNGSLTASSIAASNASGNAIITSNLLGTTAVTMSGAGTLTFKGANTYSGGTFIKNGTLVLGTGGSLLAIGAITLGDGATNTSGFLQLGDGNGAVNTTVSNLTFVGTGTADAIFGGDAAVSTLTINNSAALTYGGLFGGTGTNQNNLAVTKTGTGTLTLPIAYTYSGGTTVTARTFVLGANAAAGTGTINLAGGTLSNGAGITTANAVAVTAASSIQIGSGLTWNVNGNITGSSNLAYTAPGNPATLSLGGDNSGYSGTFTSTTDGAALQFSTATSGSAGAAWVLSNNIATRTKFGLPTSGTVNFGSLAGTAAGIVNNIAGTTVTMSVGALNTSTTFSGTIIAKAGVPTALIALTKVGTGTLILTGANTYTGLTIVNGGTLQVTTAASNPILVNVGGADIQRGQVVVDYTGNPTPATTIRGLLATSFANGFVSGQIYSSTATANRGIGYADDGTSKVTVMATLYGDADLDGGVSINDFNLLAANFGQTSKAWAQGDCDYDGGVSINDFNLLAANFGKTLASSSDGPNTAALSMWTFAVAHNDEAGFIAATGVPEPTSLAAIGFAGLLLTQRRRRSA